MALQIENLQKLSG